MKKETKSKKKQEQHAPSLPPHILKYLPPSFTGRGRGWVLEDVALELSRCPDLDAPFVLRQIEGYQRMRTKVPRWTEVEGIHFPPRLALEQCSGQPAAEYKAKVVQRLLASSPPPACRGSLPIGEGGGRGFGSWRGVDLTGGMGVDFSFIAPLFNTRAYVEQREELVEAARHNFPLLGLADAEIIHGNGIEYLQSLPDASSQPSPQSGLPLQSEREGDEAGGLFIFLDPARRDAHGGKTVLIEDCEPNVKELLPLLRSKGRYVMIKLSTMLDIHQTITTLPGISEVHVFSSGGECKDLLLVFTPDNPAEPTIYCADEAHVLTFTPSTESTVRCPLAENVEGYLYEPGPSIMKAGGYRSVGATYGLGKLHPNSHLYVSDKPIADFPGRVFRIERTYTFSKTDLKTLAADLKAEGGKANLTVRNFPATVADLRKKLKLKEGGTSYLFATTDGKEKKIIISCKKV